MLPRSEPTTNLLGRDITAALPDSDQVIGTAAMDPAYARVWERAVPHLHIRSNDVHTIHSFAIARALVDLHPDAQADVVLPAIILHDTGWSRVPADEVLEGIAPGGDRPDLVLRHEKEGASIAREVLEELGCPHTDEIVEIIDGHDSRKHALSLNDSLVKDADKLWRLTPHGVDTVMDWFGLTREQAHRLISYRVHDHLFTDAARSMARILGAVAWTDTSPQRRALG